MCTWLKDELSNTAETDDLHISTLREDGKTYGTPTWIWSVVVDDALYVRAYNGKNSRWYQAAIRQKAGRITAAGMTKEVSFEPVDGPINDLIDDWSTRPLRNSQDGAARNQSLRRPRRTTPQMIAARSMLSTSWAQGDEMKNGRKPMQTVIDSRMVAPALEKYANGPLV